MASEFLASLEKFNQQYGIPTDKDLVVGGQKIDLYRLYTIVNEAGGFDQVVADRKWKSLGAAFDFPETSTSAPYQLRQLYEKCLYKYEQVQLRAGNPPEMDIDQPDNRDNLFPTIPLELLSEDHPFKFHSMVNTELEGKEDAYLIKGPKSRLMLALESDLPNEVDWALSKLVKISYSSPPSFNIACMPRLIVELLKHIDKVFQFFKLNTSLDNQETIILQEMDVAVEQFAEMQIFYKTSFEVLFERCLQSLFILRNLSFLEQNAVYLASLEPVLVVAAKGSALANLSNLVEIKQYCLDLAENMATHVQLRGKYDFLFVAFQKLIHASDRALILASIRTLTRFCVLEENVPVIEHVSDDFYMRILQLLLVHDEEIVSAILEMLYQYSSVNNQVLKRISFLDSGNLAKFLCKFLHWRGYPQPLGQPRAAGAAALNGPLLKDMLDSKGRPKPPRTIVLQESPKVSHVQPVATQPLATQYRPQVAQYAAMQQQMLALKTQQMMQQQMMARPLLATTQVPNPATTQVPNPAKRKQSGTESESDEEWQGSENSSDDEDFKKPATSSTTLTSFQRPLLNPTSLVNPMAPSLVRPPYGMGTVSPMFNSQFMFQAQQMQQMQYQIQLQRAATAAQAQPVQPPPPKKVTIEETVLEFKCCWLDCTQVFTNEDDLEQHAVTHYSGSFSKCHWRSCVAINSFNNSQGLPLELALKHLKTHFPLATKTIVKKEVLESSSANNHSTNTVDLQKSYSIAGLGPASRPGSAGSEVSLSGIPLTAILVLRNLARTAKKLGSSEEGERLRDLFAEIQGDLAIVAFIDVRFSRFVTQILAEI